MYQPLRVRMARSWASAISAPSARIVASVVSGAAWRNNSPCSALWASVACSATPGRRGSNGVE